MAPTSNHWKSNHHETVEALLSFLQRIRSWLDTYTGIHEPILSLDRESIKHNEKAFCIEKIEEKEARPHFRACFLLLCACCYPVAMLVANRAKFGNGEIDFDTAFFDGLFGTEVAIRDRSRE